MDHYLYHKNSVSFQPLRCLCHWVCFILGVVFNTSEYSWNLNPVLVHLCFGHLVARERWLCGCGYVAVGIWCDGKAKLSPLANTPILVRHGSFHWVFSKWSLMWLREGHHKYVKHSLLIPMGKVRHNDTIQWVTIIGLWMCSECHANEWVFGVVIRLPVCQLVPWDDHFQLQF